MAQNSALNKFSLALMALAATPAFASSSAQDLQQYTSWAQQTSPQSDLLREMQASGLSDASDVADAVHRAIFTRDEQVISELMNGGCKPSSQVDFLDSGDAAFAQVSSSDENSNFESGFIRIEAVGCLSHGDAASALKTYFDPNFRRSAVSELTDSQMDNGLLCEQTQKIPFVVSSTRFCISLTPESAGSIHSMWVSLDQNADGFSPVYYREGVVTAIDTPTGPRVHVLLYARTQQKISGFFKGLARSKLGSEQSSAFELLDQRLAQQ